MSKERLISDSPDSGDFNEFPIITYEPLDCPSSEEVKEATVPEFKAGTREEIRAAFAEWSANAGFKHPGFFHVDASGKMCSTDPTFLQNQPSTSRNPPQSSRLSTNPSNPPANEVLPSPVPTQANGCCFKCVAKLAGLARRFSQSWFFIVLMFTLLIGPISYLYIGITYYQNCIYLKYFPLVFLLKGASGLLALIARVILLISAKLSDPRVFSWCVFIYNPSYILFWAIHAYEFLSFLYSRAIIEHFPGPLLCHPVVYYFAIHSLWVVPVIGLLLLVPQVSTYLAQRMEPRSAVRS